MVRRRRVRLVVASLLAGAAVAGAAVAAYSDPSPDLAPIAAEELVASLIDRAGHAGPVSGLLTTHVDIGLPSIPAGAPPAEDPVMRAIDAVNGDRRVRLWASNDGVRLALLLPASEVGWFLSRTGGRTEAWAWDSQTFTALHVGPVRGHDPGPVPVAPTFVDPLDLARRSLQALAPTTRVAVGESHRVAGRDAYRLVVEPRSAATLVGRIEISVDAERRVPLRVAVFPRGAASPALSVTFSSISFDPIPPSTYRFTPPEGATIERIDVGPDEVASPSAPRSDLVNLGPSVHTGEQVRMFGRGWESVLAVPIPASTVTDSVELAGLLPFSGSLFSIRLAERPGGAWVLVGAVPQARLASLERALP